MYKEVLALCLTLRDQAVGRSEEKQLSDVADSSVTTQTRMEKKKKKTTAKEKSDDSKLTKW